MGVICRIVIMHMLIHVHRLVFIVMAMAVIRMTCID